MGITIPLSEMQKRVAEATRVSRRTLCRVLQEGKNVGTGVTTPRNLRPKVCTESILDNFDEAVLRRIVHNFYFTEKQQQTVKPIHTKMCDPLVTEEVYPH